MLADLQHTKPIKQISKAKRPDSYWSGKMTSRLVPRVGRRPSKIKLTPGSHIVSDIGEVPIKDRSGNKYYVLFKDICTQFRIVYRMKSKDELGGVYRQFLADNRCTNTAGTIRYRTQFLVTDDDVMYVHGEVERINREQLICKYTLAPYTHNANPAESEMRRIMEGAVCNLHDSGLPPSFLLDALDCHTACMNRVYTPICHDPSHQFRTPYERYNGTKPSITDVARFGCKTFVFVPKSDRRKGDSHSWVGWYLGPSQSMRACKVYRPSTHTVYDRYHTMHDSGVVYGDFLGEMFHKRVLADQQQREYYNQEVEELLSTTLTPSTPSVTDLLRNHAWVPQPCPLIPAAPSTMPPPPPRPRTRARTVTVRTTATDTPPVTRSVTRRRALAPPAAPSTPQQATPSTQTPPARDPVSRTTTSTTTPQMSGCAEPPERLRARRLLQGIVPTSKMLQIMEAIDLTSQYVEACIANSTDPHTTSHSTSMPHTAADHTSYLTLIHLCEATSRKIASTPEPKTQRQIDQLVVSKTLEGTLVRDAMLEEVMWMISNGKVTVKDKRNIKNLYEIDGKWVVKYKKTLEGLLDRVRARWVLRGDKQRPYKDYDPSRLYSPVASRAGTATALILAVQYSLCLFSIDVSKAFTASDIDREGVHMSVPAGLDRSHPDYAPYGEHTTWELLTTLYGLRQASSTYYEKFSSVLLAYTDSKGQKYRRSEYDPCVFTKGVLGSDDYITFSVHVDDKFVACSTPEHANELVRVLGKGGLVANLEDMNRVLGYKVTYNKYDPSIPGSGTLEIDHSQYILDAFKEHKGDFKDISVCNIPMRPQDAKAFFAQTDTTFDKTRYKLYRSILGKVAHCANFTHPECSVAVSILSQRMMNPSQLDLELVFRVLRYLRNCVVNDKAKLTYRYNPHFANNKFPYNPVHLLTDADLSADVATRRSRTGHAAYLFGNLSAWASKRQQSVSLSTAESEYVALSACAKLGLWYKGLVISMGVEIAHTYPIVILSDSQSALAIASSPVGAVSKYTKHIAQRLHWFREHIRNGTLNVRFIEGENNIADIFTKNLPKPKFIQFRDKLLKGDFRDLSTIASTCITVFLNRTPPLGYACDIQCSCCDPFYSFVTTARKESLASLHNLST